MSVFRAIFEQRSGIGSSHALWEALQLGRHSSAGPVVSESTAMQIAAVATCVRLISDLVATTPVDIVERVDERTRRPAVNNPHRRLLTTPNAWQTWPDWMGMMESHVLLRGNAFSLMTRRNGIVTEFLPLHPDQVTVEQAAYPVLTVRYKWTAKDGRQYEVAAADMLHFSGLSTNGLVGRSVLEDARESMGVALATQEHTASFWKRSGLPSVVLSHPKTLSDKAKKSLETHFENTYGGGKDHRRVAVIEEGMEIKPLSVTMADAQFLETRKFQRSEIYGMFGYFPPHLAGDTEKTSSWGTGIEQQTIGFVTMGLMPKFVRLERRFEASVLKDHRLSFKFYPQSMMRGDSTSRGAWYRVMREIGAYSANDVRRLEDEPPIPNGDTYLQPTNLAPLGSTPANVKPADE